MAVLSDIWLTGALGEIAFYAITALFLLPFAAIDRVVLKKRAEGAAAGKRAQRCGAAVSLAIAVAAVAGAGCLMQFALHVDLPQNAACIFALVVLGACAFSISLWTFDLMHCRKRKKSARNDAQTTK